ncbi:S66 peptidase family protein [Flavobacterium sp. TSSA_36]|uniref:S66 peptidase family protein n=1 Tax=Flavobacterium sp. TSSA_36 TaxID=3447669 RepID=UPI003F2FB0DA
MVLSPSSNLSDTTVLNDGIQLMKDWGFHVLLAPHVYAKHYTFAGTDQQRTQDLQTAFDNPKIKAIMCGRGGYGLNRIIDALDYTKFKKKPKWFIGYSDITVLHNEFNRLRIPSIHATMLGAITKATPEARNTLQKALFGLPYSIQTPTALESILGEAEGELVGGNLSLIDAMTGSRSQLETKGKILFLEEVDEPAYKIDSMIRSLLRSGAFDGIKGLIIGDFSMKESKEDFGYTYKQIIFEAVKKYHFPIYFDFPAGHIKDNRALLFGKKATLKVGKEQSELQFN